MAITPGDAAKFNDEQELKAIDEMEKFIDGILETKYRTGIKVVISQDDLRSAGSPGYSDRAQAEVMRRFRDAGWNIKRKRNTNRYGGSNPNFEFSAEIPSPPNNKHHNSFWDQPGNR